MGMTILSVVFVTRDELEPILEFRTRAIKLGVLCSYTNLIPEDQ
jgi:hypothetical protein